VTLEVTDNGIGFDVAERHPGHMGLSTMAERAASLGGNLEVHSAPGAGTVVRVAVPIPEEDDVSIPTQ
jgi:signal transduction histidine kinase